MHKLFFQTVLILVFLSGGYTFGQKGLKLGGMAMPTVSLLFNTDDTNLDADLFKYQPLVGMSAGAVLGWNPSDNFGIRLNVIYSDAGGRYSARESFVDRINYTTRLEYLKVPLMVGLHTNSFRRKLMFSFYAGGQLNYMVRANQFNDNPTFEPPLPPNVTDYPDAYAQYEALTYSAVADFGLDVFLVDDFSLNLHLRTEYGLTDAENKGITYRLTENGQTNDVLFYPRTRSATTAASVGIVIGLTRTFGTKQNTGIPGAPIP